jgi:hypothetical protein
MEKLHEDILNLLKKYAKEEDGFQYINPHFLAGISDLLYDYYDLEDDEVDKWISDMWSA